MILDMLLVKLFLQTLVHILQADPQIRVINSHHLVRLLPAKDVGLGVDLLSCAWRSLGNDVKCRTGERVDDVDNILAVEGSVRDDESLAASRGNREGFVVREGDVSDLNKR
jgi:hypothetical protein